METDNEQPAICDVGYYYLYTDKNTGLFEIAYMEPESPLTDQDIYNLLFNNNFPSIEKAQDRIRDVFAGKPFGGSFTTISR
jgi:hypothetical protein